MTKFIAKDVLILRFNNIVDDQDMAFPVRCHIANDGDKVAVMFEDKSRVGTARIHRKGNKLLADLELTSTMQNAVEAIRLMQLLYPAIEAYIIDAHQHSVLAMRITGISLSGNRNTDPNIPPLGDSVICADLETKKGLH